jgi:hypothetical protein
MIQIPKNFQPQTTNSAPYSKEVEGSQLMYALASIGLIGVAYFTLSFAKTSPVGFAPICVISGMAGLIAHLVFSFYSSRAKRFLFWMGWIQSAILIALAFYVGGVSCQ